MVTSLYTFLFFSNGFEFESRGAREILPRAPEVLKPALNTTTNEELKEENKQVSKWIDKISESTTKKKLSK